MQRHHLNVMAYIFYRIRLSIIRVERESGKFARHRHPFNLLRESSLGYFTQSSAHSVHCSVSGSSPLRGNWVPNHILPRPFPMSMRTKLIKRLPVSTSYTHWSLCMLFVVSSSTSTSCFQLQLSYQPPQTFKLFNSSIRTFMSKCARHCPVCLKRPISKTKLLFSLLMVPIFMPLLPSFPPAIFGKIPQSHFQHNFPIVVQTFSLCRSQLNYSFVGDHHRRRQLCVPNFYLMD